MGEDLLSEYESDSEEDRLELWLGHPEMRDEFTELDHLDFSPDDGPKQRTRGRLVSVRDSMHAAMRRVGQVWRRQRHGG